MNYPIRTLEEVCTINPRRPVLNRMPEQTTSFVQMSSLEEINGTITKIEERPFQEIASGYTYFEDYDVLFAKITPCMQNGKCAIAKGLIDGFGFGSTEFHVLRAGPEIIPDWIHSFLRQPSFRAQARAAMTGAVGQQRVPTDFLGKALIPLPDLKTQRKIATRLKEQLAAVDIARRAANEQLETIDKLPAAYLRQAFTNSN